MKKHLGAALCCALLMIGERSFSSEAAPSPGINLLNRLVQDKIVGPETFRLTTHPIPAPRESEPASASVDQQTTAPESANDAQQEDSAAQVNDLTQQVNDVLARNQILESELAALRSVANNGPDDAALRDLERASKDDRQKAATLASQLAEVAAQKAALEQQFAALKTSGGSDRQVNMVLTEDLKKAGAEIASLKKQMADLQAQKTLPAKTETAGAAPRMAINDSVSRDVRASYAVGAWYGDSAPQETKKFNSIGRKLDLQAFSQGFQDRVNNRMQLSQGTVDADLASIAQLLDTAMLSQNQKQSKAVMEKAAKEKGAIRTADGSVYKILNSGKKPMATDQSSIQFELDEELGTGEVLASGEKGSSKVKDLPPLFQTVVKQLGVGGSAKMYVPGEQVYGESGIPGVVPPGVLSIMTIKVVGVK